MRWTRIAISYATWPMSASARGQDGQAGALAGRAHDEEARRHLDDGLACLAAELVARAARQRLERRRERGQVLDVGLVHAPGSAERQAVLREEHRPRDVRNPHHQVIEQPVELVHRVSLVSFHRLRPPCPVASVTGPAASRAAWRTACCACPSAMPRLPGEQPADPASCRCCRGSAKLRCEVGLADAARQSLEVGVGVRLPAGSCHCPWYRSRAAAAAVCPRTGSGSASRDASW